MVIKLSTLSILLGLGFALPNLFALLRPASFTAAARNFPRSLAWGYPLVLLATVWFIWNVKQESIADFESMKPMLYTLFLFVGLGTCIFVKDFLAARGFAVILLLLAKLMVDTARWADSDWRLVISIWAYVWIIAGIWLTISPWRMRDLIAWQTANDKRLRTVSIIRLVFGLFVATLGIVAFKS